MTIDLNLTIEQIVKDTELSYMEAVLDYAKNSEIEPEAMAKMLNQSLKDKIEVEAQNLNMLKKSGQLPIQERSEWSIWAKGLGNDFILKSGSIVI